jgi:hypothetical protein
MSIVDAIYRSEMKTCIRMSGANYESKQHILTFSNSLKEPYYIPLVDLTKHWVECEVHDNLDKLMDVLDDIRMDGDSNTVLRCHYDRMYVPFIQQQFHLFLVFDYNSWRILSKYNAIICK